MSMILAHDTWDSEKESLKATAFVEGTMKQASISVGLLSRHVWLYNSSAIQNKSEVSSRAASIMHCVWNLEQPLLPSLAILCPKMSLYAEPYFRISFI